MQIGRLFYEGCRSGVVIAEFLEGFTGTSNVGQLHLGVLTRENDARCSGLESREGGGFDVGGLGTFFVEAGGDVDVDARIDWDLSFDVGDGAFCLDAYRLSRGTAGR